MTEPSIALIIKVAAGFFKVSKIDLISQRRTLDLMFSRHAAIWVAKTLTTKSLPQIGRAFGRDHTTILHSVRAVETARTEDASVLRTTDNLLLEVQATALTLIKLNARIARDIDGIAVAEAIVGDPMKVTTVSVNELYALATATLHLSDQLARNAQLLVPDQAFEDSQSCRAIQRVLAANRTLESSRYGPGERVALDDLSARINGLRDTVEHNQGR